MLNEVLAQLGAVPPGILTALAAICGAIGAIFAALIAGLFGKLVVTPFLSARDKQDREAEWRKHAIELAKLDLERKLRSGRDFKSEPLRPSILDFLANYRDLQELGTKSPGDLYSVIHSTRIKRPHSESSAGSVVEAMGDENDG